MSCRNVLIYFNRELQDRAIGLFRDALCRKGFLGIGAKESLRLLGARASVRRARARAIGSTRSEDAAVMSGDPLAIGRRCRRRRHRHVGGGRRGALGAPARAAGATAAAGLRRLAPAARPAQPAGGDLLAASAPCRSARRRTRSRSRPGTVYFAPPDYHLLRRRRAARSRLSADELVNYSRPSIDVLFESAADVYGQRLLGIILTGASHDGAAGSQAVRRAGGLHRRPAARTPRRPRSCPSRLSSGARSISC